jgi:hypothetical protein
MKYSVVWVLMTLKGPPNSILINIYFVKVVLFILCFCYEGTEIFVICRQYFVKTVFFITDFDCTT